MKQFRPLFRSTVNYWLIVSMGAIITLLVWKYLYQQSPMRDNQVVVEYETEDSPTSDTLHINYANATELSRFGLRPNVIVNILKYRDAGGSIKDEDHLLKIRGIDTALVREKGNLIAYNRPLSVKRQYYEPKERDRETRQHYKPSRRISLYYTSEDSLAALGIKRQIIDSIIAYRRRYIMNGSITLDSLLEMTPTNFAQAMSGHISPRKNWERDTTKQKREEKRIYVNVNTATEKELCEIVGIGEKTARQIIERRAKLGGFVDKRQLAEIKYIDSARYAQIEEQVYVSTASIKRLKINEATKEEVLGHPYMRKELGRQLLRLRYRHKKLSRDMVIQELNDTHHDQWLLEYLEF